MNKPNNTKQELYRWIELMTDTQNMALLLIASHLENYYQAAVEAAGEDPKTKMRFALTVDRSGTREHVKVQVSFSRATTDESECWVEDPNQTELPLEKPEKAETPFVTLQLTERAEVTDCVDAEIIEEDAE